MVQLGVQHLQRTPSVLSLPASTSTLLKPLHGRSRVLCDLCRTWRQRHLRPIMISILAHPTALTQGNELAAQAAPAVTEEAPEGTVSNRSLGSLVQWVFRVDKTLSPQNNLQHIMAFLSCWSMMVSVLEH